MHLLDADAPSGREVSADEQESPDVTPWDEIRHPALMLTLISRPRGRNSQTMAVVEGRTLPRCRQLDIPTSDAAVAAQSRWGRDWPY
jgi:hypothetical protein